MGRGGRYNPRRMNESFPRDVAVSPGTAEPPGGVLGVILCRCDYAHVVPAADCARIERALTVAGCNVWAVADLCERAASRDPALLQRAAEPGTVVIACLPRAVHALLRGAGLPGTAPLPRVLGWKVRTGADVLRELGVTDPGPASTPAPGADAPPPEWPPWFPAIDYDRCTGCRQCLSFCPFGVYTLAENKRVVVTNPRNCKNHCPACARICPEFAIVFPKVKDEPIDGSEVQPRHIERRKAAVLDPDSDIHALLARRRQRAGIGQFERNLRDRDAAGPVDGARSQAEEERATCMEKAGEGPARAGVP